MEQGNRTLEFKFIMLDGVSTQIMAAFDFPHTQLDKFPVSGATCVV